MVPQRTNFEERREPAPDRGGKFQLAGAAKNKVSPLLPLVSEVETVCPNSHTLIVFMLTVVKLALTDDIRFLLDRGEALLECLCEIKP